MYTIIIKFLLTKIAQTLTSKEFVTIVINEVTTASTLHNTSGQGKREYVLKAIKNIAYGFGSQLVNFVLESVVMITKLEEKKNA